MWMTRWSIVARHHGLADLLGRLNPVLRGWCAYFRHGVSKATFGYLDAFPWHRVTQWLLTRHKRITWADLYRRFLTGRPGNRPQENGIIMFDTPPSRLLGIGGGRATSPHRGPAEQRPWSLLDSDPYIIGTGRSAIGTLVERSSRSTILVHLPRLEGWGEKRP